MRAGACARQPLTTGLSTGFPFFITTSKSTLRALCLARSSFAALSRLAAIFSYVTDAVDSLALRLASTNWPVNLAHSNRRKAVVLAQDGEASASGRLAAGGRAGGVRSTGSPVGLGALAAGAWRGRTGSRKGDAAGFGAAPAFSGDAAGAAAALTAAGDAAGVAGWRARDGRWFRTAGDGAWVAAATAELRAGAG